MIFAGSMLWAQGPDQDSQWVDGIWNIDRGQVRRLQADHASVTPTVTGYAIPGMVDVHCHLGIGDEGPVGQDEQRQHALDTLRSGVLAIRDCGVPVDNSWMKTDALAPILIHSGRHLARPKRYLRDLPIEATSQRDLPILVAEQAKNSDGWVKIIGDWIDRSNGVDSDLDPLWDRKVVIDAVAAAHDEGARVAVHSFSHRAIDDLLDAGVDDIEHGSGMDADQLNQAVRQGVLVDPTLLQVQRFKDFAAQAGAKYPVYAATMRQMYEHRREHFGLLVDSGVELVLGTDSGGFQRHGTVFKELAMWQEWGMAPSRIVDVATWRTRRAMGLPALYEGATADLVILQEDPRRDIQAIAGPRTVVLSGCVID
ncbi:amidohydrolase family protein [Schaalia vaccimaxillae]|uniref:amidohydrolase family protein n=1 Tax=Schaalia vaccimaxillae TaxID=183916 RepID=UPI0003B4C2BD|nr:amidohydrolase family protein [Schaalia vaccimaxillae]